MTDYDFDEAADEIFVNYHFEFATVRLIENTFMPVHFEVRAEVIEQPDADQFALDLAFTKIKFFFTQVIDSRSLIFCRDNTWALERVLLAEEGSNATGNTLVITPDEPSDEHIAALLQCKLNALAGGAATFGLVEVKSNNLDGLSFTFVGDGEFILPTMVEWIGERSYFSKPWWARNDASTLDVVPPEDADLGNPPNFAYSLDFLVNVLQPSDTSGVIVRPEFRPTVIDGGRS